MSDELKTPDENPFASPREVSRPDSGPDFTESMPDQPLDLLTVIVFTILSIISALIGFTTSCGAGFTMSMRVPDWIRGSLFWGSPVVGILSAAGTGYLLRALAKRDITDGAKIDRLLLLSIAVIVGATFVQVVFFHVELPVSIIRSLFYFVLFAPLLGLITAIVAGVRRLIDRGRR